MPIKYPSDRNLAAEQELWKTLESARVEYEIAPPEEKADARQRYLDALRKFSHFVSPRAELR